MLHHARLSSAIETIADHYPIVVVGSGYGGGIAASRLARAGQQVCVLERGKERQPGEYPQTEAETVPEIQASKDGARILGGNGLYDMRFYDDINVLVGCGLGGTSLINANVSIRPDPRLFADERWPAALRADPAGLEAGYERARTMLKPTPVPPALAPAKLRAMARSGAAMAAPTYRAEVNVTFECLPDDVNHVGVEQHACNECGDCVTGCNHGAKNSTLMNYLPDAVNHGAVIYTEVEVRRISRNADGTYAVHYRILDARQESFGAAEETVTADLVVLAAGTLGSTEILLRSQAAGLAVSPQLGHGFTGNGDVLGFGYNCDQRINGIGWGHRAARHMKLDRPGDGVGPCITSVIDLRDLGGTGDPNQGMIIEEGALPGAIAGFLPAAMDAGAKLFGVDTDDGLVDAIREKAREVVSVFGGAYHGAMQNTQTYLVMSHEHTSGQLRFDRDRMAVTWPHVGDEPLFERVNERLIDVTRALGGTYVKSPLWTDLFKHHLITVHPLGGCVMADTAETGVVNHKGQVFSASAGEAVHAGLYVADGSVIPRSLGCNPLLTISAIAERSCALIAEDRGWTIDYALPSRPARRAAQADTLGIEFTERMAGHFSTRVVERAATVDDFRAAEADGRATDSTFEFVLTIVAEDLDRLIADDAYEAGMVGSVRAPALSAQPLTATEGRFVLAARDPESPGGKTMRYRMKLSSAEGRHYWFEGTKYIKDDPGLDLWSDTTTLYITVSDGAAPGGPVVGRGVLHIHPTDFLKQLRATRAVNAHGIEQRLEAVARFGAHFVGSLWDVYGGVFARATELDPGAPPRKKRVLRAPAPELHELAARDGTLLRLTRYRGTKGPVLLAHGLGVSSSIFSIDTIETNLLEYLCERGYDVWLLDFRSSIALPAHRTQYTGDDVARHDFPAAVERVLAVTGKASVQVVAHCFGATTFTMAMLAGLEGVRSAVISQISTHISTPPLTRIKTGLHIPEVLDAFGITSLTAHAARPDWKDRLLDTALRLYPTELEERCRSKVCHRIALLYAPLYEHDQLNAATHDAMHEMFGDASITAFEHLARLSRAGHLVTADGSEGYMDRLERLAIPIAFLHGAENACFLPRSTEDTVAALAQANAAALYKRHVIPDYGHIDCIFGKHAARDVYPHIVEHLEATR